MSRKVRELRCSVEMDAHAVSTSRILDVEDFAGASSRTFRVCSQATFLVSFASA